MNFFYQVKECVIDFKFYKSIKNNRFGKTFLYLLLLLLIIYTVLTAKNFILVNAFAERFAFELSENIADFEFKDGKFSFAGQMPYYISSSTSELVVIDTTGSVKPDVLDNAITGILITEDKVYSKNVLQSYVINLADFKGLDFNKQTLIDALPKLSWLVPYVMIVVFMIDLMWKLINALLLALIGMMINSKYKTDLSFKHLFNFSVYALTLPMLIKLAVNISGYMVPFFFAIYWAISIVYMRSAIRAYKESDNEDGVRLV